MLKFGTPAAIYAQAQKHETSSVRPIETVRPLAKMLGLTIDKDFDRDDYRNMVKEILAAKKYKSHSVLICWEHKVIPKIVQRNLVPPTHRTNGTVQSTIGFGSLLSRAANNLSFRICLSNS